MKWLDRRLRDLRIAQAMPWIREGDRLLDIGCFDTTLLERASGRLQAAWGVDPLATPIDRGTLRVLRGVLPGEVTDAQGRTFALPEASFECVTMLAVLEHVPDAGAIARECARLLAPGGRVVITVPRPQVDRILDVLRALRLIKGMSLEEHHGYDVEQTPRVFEQGGFRLLKRASFELGLNCLFIFEKAPAETPADARPLTLARAADTGQGRAAPLAGSRAQ